MIDLNDMVIFAKVAEKQGISSAARALNMPKSKVSRRMVMLEESLGVRLLERNTRSVHITEAGNIYLQHCKRVAEEAVSALESVNQLANTPQGLLRISVSVTIGQQLIAPYLGEFMQQYPNIDIDIELNNRRVDMIAEGFDVVVRVGQLKDSSLICKPLGKSRARLYASPGYLAKNGEPYTLSDLAQHKKLVMTDTTQVHRWLLENRQGIQEFVSINPVLSINDLIAMRTIMLADGGIAYLPEYLAEDSVQLGQLKIILPEWQSPVIPYYVLYPSHRGLTQKTKAWVNFYSQHLEKHLSFGQ